MLPGPEVLRALDSQALRLGARRLVQLHGAGPLDGTPRHGCWLWASLEALKKGTLPPTNMATDSRYLPTSAMLVGGRVPYKQQAM